MKLLSSKTRLQFSALAMAASLIFSTASAQLKLSTDTIHTKIGLKRYLIPCTSMFVSGVLDGTIEAINYHYQDGFKRAFPHANDQYWNPAISWTNKYKNNNPSAGPRFAGSTTLFVCTTDAYHGLRTLRNFTDAFTLTLYIHGSYHNPKKPTLRRIITDALLFAAIRDIGFTAMYSGVFREAGHE